MKKMIVLMMLIILSGSSSAQEFRVFETMLQSTDPVDQVAERVVGQLEEAGYRVLSSREVGVGSECASEARVLSVWYPEGVQALFDLNARTAPYGVVERIGVFSDEDGTWVSAIHPGSVLRTVFLDDTVADGLASERRLRLRAALSATLDRSYGQQRERGKIGKTMGVMAGGPFDERLGELVAVSGTTVADAAELVSAGFDAQEGDWAMTIAYRLDVPEKDLVIFGISSNEMEARSFSIVGAGSDKERKEFLCAGTAYAPAYPIEMVVRSSAEGVVVETVDAMFRMKLFFEDAGKLAFMKNMTMPGSLASEIKNRVEGALAGGGS